MKKRNILEYFLEIKSIFPPLKDFFRELEATRKSLTIIPEYIVFYLIMVPTCIFVYIFMFLLTFILVLLFLTKQLVIKIINLNTVSIDLSSIYNQDFISEILCGILIEAYRELGITAPVSIKDILPVKHTLLQYENGFSYYRFIVHHPPTENVDLVFISDFLNLKLCQYLQVHCSNYQILYNDMPVLKVFRVNESLQHPNCYEICLMLIDTDAKYNYLNSLEIQKNNGFSTTLSDEDF